NLFLQMNRQLTLILKSSDEVLEIMVKMNETHDTTFIFSTHDPQVMEYANRLIEIKDGQITKDKKGEDVSVHN
ncbi:MAG: hypothetical protein ACLFUI_05325, partial [Halanaerobiales bacterium]